MIACLMATSMLFGFGSRLLDRGMSTEQGQGGPFADVGDLDDEPSDVLVDLEDDDFVLPTVPSLSSALLVTRTTPDSSETHLAIAVPSRLFRPPRPLLS
jgi:hypothetical protein